MRSLRARRARDCCASKSMRIGSNRDTGTRLLQLVARKQNKSSKSYGGGRGVKMFFIDEIEDRRGPENLNCKKVADLGTL
jgi:hypothetical protein